MKLTISCSNNDLLPGRCQAIIWTNAGILLIVPLGTNFSEILIKTYTFSFKKMHLKMSSGKWRPFCLGLNVLRTHFQEDKKLSWKHIWPCSHYMLNLQSWGWQSGGRFKNTYELLNPRALKIPMLNKIVSFNVWVRYSCGISKVPFEIPHK